MIPTLRRLLLVTAIAVHEVSMVASASAGIGELSSILANPTPESNDLFGYSVASVGDKIVVGAPRDNTLAKDAGAAYLFDRNGTLLQTFVSPTPDEGDWFGFSVATVGENILIGAARDDTWAMDSGAAYLFNQQGRLLTTFFSPSPKPYESFGASLSAAGKDVLIGAYRAKDAVTGTFEAGVAHLFTPYGSLLQTYHNPEPGESDHFGYSLTGVGDKIVIGAYGDDTGAKKAGSVYVFDRQGNLERTIANPFPGAYDAFGVSVAAWGNDRILIGATMDDSAGPDTGTVYAFDVNGALIQTFPNPSPGTGHNFGLHVVAVEDHVVVGAHRAGSGLIRSGGVHVFDETGKLVKWVSNASAGINPDFGFALAANQGDIVVGAPLAMSPSGRAGSVFIFEGPGQPASLAGDLDADGDVDAADFRLFKALYLRATSIHGPGDFNGDGVVDISDFGWLKRNFGQKLATSGAEVPEPSALVLAMLAAGAGLSLRRPVSRRAGSSAHR